jgi:DNA repair exonuclease SbcCD ATPase subunit
MEDLQIDIYTFFGVIEVALIALVVAGVLGLRGKTLSARIRTLQGQLNKAADVPPPVGFTQYLRDEVLRNQGLYDQANASTDEAEKSSAELLALRRQFLELEVAAREHENNPVQFLQTLTAGFGALVEQWRPPAETVEVAVPAEGVVDLEEAHAGEEEDAPRATLETHEQEFGRLKQVILNQQDAMAALRAELQAREADIEDLDSILQKLDEFERHDAELQQCLRMLERENQRLKDATAAGGKGDKSGARSAIQKLDPAQLNGLRSMIGNQQKTIGNLQSLIQELAPEASKAAELAAAIRSIESANRELNSCVAVLEDENANLRAELDAVNAQLQHQEELAAAAAAVADATEPAAALADDGDVALQDEADDAGQTAEDEEKYQLEIKVQELEALVEFKDAAIEELEKQYNTLEAKYLALSGEK